MKNYSELTGCGGYFAGLLIRLPVVNRSICGRVALRRDGASSQIHQPGKRTIGDWRSRH